MAHSRYNDRPSHRSYDMREPRIDRALREIALTEEIDREPIVLGENVESLPQLRVLNRRRGTVVEIVFTAETAHAELVS